MLITFPSGDKKNFESGVTGLDIAQSISRSLAKQAVGMRLNGTIVDLLTCVSCDSTVEIITQSMPEGLEIIRHSCAHLMAQAVQELFSDVQVTIGPVIENGFYYDFATKNPFTENDLEKIEERMKEVASRKLDIQRHHIDRDDAVNLFKEMKEDFKVEIISSIDTKEQLSFYKQGDFIDLCRGPHVPNTSFIKYFKLMKVAGAYWRGDHKNEQLQRVYGTCWSKEADLKSYLKKLEMAKERDHRIIGAQMELFHLQDEAPGTIFWHESGWTLFELIQRKIVKFLDDEYKEVKTPMLIDRTLWEKSGHWAMFQENMFSFDKEEKQYAIKPMNCPCHVQIFKQKLHSYRDLPLRMSEFGSCHRYEPSGALHGLMRLRHFTQDDGHIFCTPEQILTEVKTFNSLLYKVYKSFGFNTIMVKLSTRPDKRVGDDALWDQAEQALKEALTHSQIDFEIQEGEGAFYGPKIEFVLTDCLDRHWQCGTVQLDFSMPNKLGATYIDQQGQKKHPVMIHRAILGSIERFIGILIEHYAGRLPVDIAPIQCVVIPVSEKFVHYAQQVKKQLKDTGLRLKIDTRNEKIGYKIRDWTLKKAPYFVIVGEKELASSTVTLRHFKGESSHDLTINDCVDMILNEKVDEQVSKQSCS